jgi:Plasmid pRiA4b ORF-3-like protein
MSQTAIGAEIKDPNQKFIYTYDFNKNWTFLVELINVDKEENRKLDYPCCLRSEGIAPSQYGTKGLVDSRLAEVEEKYDLNAEALVGGFGEEGEEDSDSGEAGEEQGSEEVGDEF